VPSLTATPRHKILLCPLTPVATIILSPKVAPKLTAQVAAQVPFGGHVQWGRMGREQKGLRVAFSLVTDKLCKGIKEGD
jgi:hypothetical protein